MTITVGCSDYTLGSLTGSYDDNVAAIQSQPWWGDGDLVDKFSNAYDAATTTTIDGAKLNLFSYSYNSGNNNVYSSIYESDDVFNSNQNAAYSSVDQTFMTATLIAPVNVAPTASAGPDQASVASAASVSLDGSGSSDTNSCDTLTYAWKQTAGSTVALSDATAAQPTFTAPTLSATDAAETLTFSLVVTDNNSSDSVADTVDITVNPPAGATPTDVAYNCDKPDNPNQGTPGDDQSYDVKVGDVINLTTKFCRTAVRSDLTSSSTILANGTLLQYGQPTLNGSNVDYSGDPWTSPTDTFVVTVKDATSFSFKVQDWNYQNYITFTFNVTQDPTTTALTTSSATPNFGDTVTLTATLDPSVATGTVTFKEGADTLGTGTLSGGVATLDTASLVVGDHTITAEYGGDAGYEGSTSSSVTVTVAAVTASTSTTSLTTSSATPALGDDVTLTATVAPSDATGNVTFIEEGSGTLGTGTLSGGVATFDTTSLVVGVHTITAEYAGDSTYDGSTSSSVTVTVGTDSVAAAFAARADKIRTVIVEMARQSLQSAIDSNLSLARQARTDFIESQRFGANDVGGSVPFGVAATAQGTGDKITAKGTFFQKNSSLDGAHKRLFFGTFDVQSGPHGTSTATLNAKLSWDSRISDRAEIGYYVGADFGRSTIAGDFAGTQAHYGVSVGAYAVYRLGKATFVDGFASIGAGTNGLRMGDDTLDLISTYGTNSAIIGGALTTTLTQKSYEFWPELAFSYGATNIGRVGLSGRAFGLQDNTLGLDAGQVSIASILLRPEVRVPLDGLGAAESLDLLSLSPRFACQWDITSITRRDCGAGLEIGLTRQWGAGLGHLTAKLISEQIGGRTRSSAQVSFQQRF